MKFTKAGSLVLAFLVLILSSCGFEKNEPKEEKVRKEKRKYTVAVSEEVGEVGLEAVKEFCSRANELSEGTLTLVYKISKDALEDFYNGSDFIFAANEEISRANGDFASYTSPFYFEDRDSALLTLNSQKFIDSTSDVTQSLLNAKQLGCYYNGTYTFISSKVDDLLGFSHDGKPFKIFDDLRVYGDFNYVDEYLLSDLGFDTIETESDELIQRFNEAQSHTVMIKKHELDNIQLPERRKMIYYYDQSYKYDFNWLFISDRVLEEMNPKYLDIITEAAAYSIGFNDEEIIKRENIGEQSLNKYPVKKINYYFEGAVEFVNDAYSGVRFKRIWDINNHETVKNILE